MKSSFAKTQLLSSPPTKVVWRGKPQSVSLNLSQTRHLLPRTWFLIYFYWSIVALYNVVLASTVQQST